jgi:HPt (histidine-containing phosphotransfer) domain-containing protein
VVALISNKLQGERCMKMGMNDYIVKPLSLGELRRVIAKQLPAADAESAFDEASALGRLNGDRSFLRALATIFVEESPVQLDEIRSAIDEHDSRKLFRAAHKLKGSAYPFSARELCRLTQMLESLGESGQMDGAPDQFRQCATACARLQSALADLLSREHDSQVSPGDTSADSEGAIPCTV